ncbi:LOW QUALITY PROTEIN: uncharacterized protein RBU47_006765 [Passerculus sandwichensis]
MTSAFLLVLTILAMFSWRYSQAFPLDTVNRAADFMAKLRQIYPHADTLCEKHFEWLFDCPETKQFLEWFCSTVGEENVLSPAEVEAYEARLAAGKPILEGDALEEALQIMFCQVLQLPSSIVDEGPSQEALQQELQELKHYHDLQLWRYRKLLAWTNKLQQEQKYLEEEKKVVKQELKLMGKDQKKQQPFRSYAVLAAKCSQLVQDKRALEAQLEAPLPQVSALESSMEVLYHQLYSSSNQLQLSLLEISELMEQLIIVEDDLYQKLADLLSDLGVKRRSLESPMLQAECSLYVHFYCSGDRLRQEVEEGEKQASPPRELPYGKEYVQGILAPCHRVKVRSCMGSCPG